MNYIKTLWTNHVVKAPNTFKMSETGDGTILSPAFGDVLQQGTPANVYNMNKIEDGVYNLYRYGNDLSVMTKQLNANIMDLAYELRSLKNADLIGVNTNVYLEHFNNLDDIILLEGNTEHDGFHYKLTITDY